MNKIRALGALIVVVLVVGACASSKAPTKVLGVQLTATPTPTPAVHHTGPCVNSFDPKCGKLHWEPAPGHNAAMTITLSTPASAKAGEPVTITATAVDPDAPISCDYHYFGVGAYVGNAISTRPRYGLWETPAKQRGERTFTYTHTYSKPGTYHLQVTVVSGSSCVDPNADPYGNTGIATGTLTVSA